MGQICFCGNNQHANTEYSQIRPCCVWRRWEHAQCNLSPSHVFSSAPGAAPRAFRNSVSADTTSMPTQGFPKVHLAVFGGAIALAYSNMPTELSSALSATMGGVPAHVSCSAPGVSLQVLSTPAFAEAANMPSQVSHNADLADLSGAFAHAPSNTPAELGNLLPALAGGMSAHAFSSSPGPSLRALPTSMVAETSGIPTQFLHKGDSKSEFAEAASMPTQVFVTKSTLLTGVARSRTRAAKYQLNSATSSCPCGWDVSACLQELPWRFATRSQQISGCENKRHANTFASLSRSRCFA